VKSQRQRLKKDPLNSAFRDRGVPLRLSAGLDSAGANLVVKVMSNACTLGKTLICTIHQPSAAIFYAFHSLLLLKPGGRMVRAPGRVVRIWQGINQACQRPPSSERRRHPRGAAMQKLRIVTSSREGQPAPSLSRRACSPR
jgi:ABC-type multidrug transport system ATPase subunit